MTNEVDIAAQRKNAVKTAKLLFLGVIIVIVIYVFWYKSFIVNRTKAKQRAKGNNLTKIVDQSKGESKDKGNGKTAK